MRSRDAVPRPGPGLLLTLVVIDLRHEWRLTLCAMLGIAAVLGPFLLLLGLKVGLVAGFLETLRRDPTTLEIRHVGQARLAPGWFEDWGTDPRVAFLVGNTRHLNTMVRAQTTEDAQPGPMVDLEMIPSAPGDPLMRVSLDATAAIAAPETPSQVVLTARAATRLGATVGTPLRLIIGRHRTGRTERVAHAVTTIGVLPAVASTRVAALVSVPLLEAVEGFRSGFETPLFSAAGDPMPPGPRHHASFRLYAHALDDVPGLAADLEATGLELITRADAIERVRRTDDHLALVFSILVSMAVLGFGASTTISLWATVERKKADLAMLRLLGVPSGGIRLFVHLHSLVTATGGIILALCLYGLAAPLAASLLAEHLDDGQALSRLEPGHLALAVALTLGLAFAASLVGSLYGGRLNIAQCLRES